MWAASAPNETTDLGSERMYIFLGLSVVAAFFVVPIVAWILYSRAQTRRYNAAMEVLAERFGLRAAEGQNLGWEWLRIEGSYRGMEVTVGAKVEYGHRADSITGIGSGAKMVVPEARLESFRIVKNHRVNRLTLGSKVVSSGEPTVDRAALILCSHPELVLELVNSPVIVALIDRLWGEGGTYRDLSFSDGEFFFSVSSYFRPALANQPFADAIELMAELGERISA